MGPQRPEEMDRQFSLVRHLDHLGARSRRRPSQGVYRREQDHTRFQGRQNSEQDRPQGRAERLDHDGELPRSGRKPPAKRSIVPRYGARPENDAIHGRLGGKMTDAHASLAKAFTTAKCRETVAWARELLGGNGIAAEYNVGRFFVDAEALYSYEGTFQMQNLILGKTITGLSAFI